MKKPFISFLLILTLIFSAFSLGFFVGRNHNRTTIEPLTRTQETTQSHSESSEPATGTENTAAETTENVAAESTQIISADPVLIDINTATHAELVTLPGIGDVLAQRIIDYRDAHGAFSAPEELLSVNGIGEKKLEAILNLITVGG